VKYFILVERAVAFDEDRVNEALARRTAAYFVASGDVVQVELLHCIADEGVRVEIDLV